MPSLRWMNATSQLTSARELSPPCKLRHPPLQPPAHSPPGMVTPYRRLHRRWILHTSLKQSPKLISTPTSVSRMCAIALGTAAVSLPSTKHMILHEQHCSFTAFYPITCINFYLIYSLSVVFSNYCFIRHFYLLSLSESLYVDFHSYVVNINFCHLFSLATFVTYLYSYFIYQLDSLYALLCSLWNSVTVFAYTASPVRSHEIQPGSSLTTLVFLCLRYRGALVH